MKTLQKIGLLFLFIAIITSCSKNNDEDDSSSGGDFFTAKIDGTTWEAFSGPPDTVAWNEAHPGLIVITR